MAQSFEGKVIRSTLVGLAVVCAATAAASAPARATTVDYLQIGTVTSPAPLGPHGDSITIDVTSLGSLTVLASGTSLTAPRATAGESGGAFSYGYTFSLGATTPDLLGAGRWANISKVTGNLYEDTKTTVGYTVGTTAITPSVNFSSPNPSVIPSTLDYAGLSAGLYTLELSGAVTGNTSLGIFAGSLTAVPVPGALVMFGTAVAALAGFGARRRRTAAL